MKNQARIYAADVRALGYNAEEDGRSVKVYQHAGSDRLLAAVKFFEVGHVTTGDRALDPERVDRLLRA